MDALPDRHGTFRAMDAGVDSCLGDTDDYLLVDAYFDSDGLTDALADPVDSERNSALANPASTECEQHIKDLAAQLAHAEALRREWVEDSQKREAQEMRMTHTEVRRVVKEELERQSREWRFGQDCADIRETVERLEQMVNGLSDAVAQRSVSNGTTPVSAPKEYTEETGEWAVSSSQQSESAAKDVEIGRLEAHVQRVGSTCMEAVRKLSARMDTLEQSLTEYRSSEQFVSASVEQASGQEQQQCQLPLWLREYVKTAGTKRVTALLLAASALAVLLLSLTVVGGSHMLSGWSAELCNDGGARRPVSALQTMDVSSGGGLPSDKCMADARPPVVVNDSVIRMSFEKAVQQKHAVEKAASEQRQGTPPAATSDQQRPSEAGSPGQHITNDKASPQTVPPADSAAYDCCSRDGARSRHEEPAPKRKDTAEKHIKAGQKSKEHEAAPDRGQHTPTREHGQTERYAKAIKNWWDERERGRAELRYG